jgi:hypothetical protein
MGSLSGTWWLWDPRQPAGWLGVPWMLPACLLDVDALSCPGCGAAIVVLAISLTGRKAVRVSYAPSAINAIYAKK